MNTHNINDTKSIQTRLLTRSRCWPRCRRRANATVAGRSRLTVSSLSGRCVCVCVCVCVCMERRGRARRWVAQRRLLEPPRQTTRKTTGSRAQRARDENQPGTRRPDAGRLAAHLSSASGPSPAGPPPAGRRQPAVGTCVGGRSIGGVFKIIFMIHICCFKQRGKQHCCNPDTTCNKSYLQPHPCETTAYASPNAGPRAGGTGLALLLRCAYLSTREGGASHDGFCVTREYHISITPKSLMTCPTPPEWKERYI